MKRELGVTLTGKQTWNGHIMKDPWSSIAQTVGWGIFPFEGVVDVLQKISLQKDLLIRSLTGLATILEVGFLRSYSNGSVMYFPL